MLVALVIAACGTTAAGGHDNSCHQAHTCPADDHSYEWNGMSCTSDPAQRLPADQTPVTYDGIQYWCHTVVDQGMTPGPTGTQTQPTASPGAPCTSRAATGAVRLHGVGTIDGVGYFDADRAALKLRPVLRLTSVRC